MLLDALIDLARLTIVGIIADLFASYRANRDFRRQRWWELQADAYTRVIDALSDLKNYYGTLLDSEMVKSKVTVERRLELEAQWKEATALVSRATNSGAFLFSDKVAISLRALEKEQDRYHDSWFEHLESNWVAVRDCLEAVTVASKKDLQIPRGWRKGRRNEA